MVLPRIDLAGGRRRGLVALPGVFERKRFTALHDGPAATLGEQVVAAELDLAAPRAFVAADAVVVIVPVTPDGAVDRVVDRLAALGRRVEGVGR